MDARHEKIASLIGSVVEAQAPTLTARARCERVGMPTYDSESFIWQTACRTTAKQIAQAYCDAMGMSDADVGVFAEIAGSLSR